MIRIVLLVCFYLFFPIVIIWLCRKWTLLQKIGTIGVAYLVGIAIGSAGIFPEGSRQYKLALAGRPVLPETELTTLIDEGAIEPDDVLVNQIATVHDMIPAAAVIVAFPLLLFSLNIRRWMRSASKGFLSIILGLISGVVMVTIGFFIWKDSFPESYKLAAMFEAMYTGGTPNFVALQVALKVDPALFIIATTYDIVVGAGLVLFFISVAPPIFRFILPSNNEKASQVSLSDNGLETSDPEDFSGMLAKDKLWPLGKALLLAILIAAVSGGFGFLMKFIIPDVNFNAVVILSVTLLGIGASMIKRINGIAKSFHLGMYLILVFALTVASMADLDKIANVGMASLIIFISWCYFGSLVLHLILAKIFRIDSDNFLITSTALIFSPPFVPLVAKSLKNKDVMITGITGGIIGLMLGNIIGIALSVFLQQF